MCQICHRNPCLSGCPNAPDPPKVHVCKYCMEDIVVGDEYYEYGGNYYHEDCFEEDAVHILLNSGATKQTASENEIDDGSDYLHESRRDESLLKRCGYTA